MCDYIRWQKIKAKPHSFSLLLSRPALTKWLYALFLKLAIPFYRPPEDWMQLIYTPLNLTIFLRLLTQLRDIGYPSHWLTDILANILENDVVTTARPPETYPLKIDEAHSEHPLKRFQVRPFMPEMRTLTTIFQRILPFSVMTSTLPPPNRIHHYSVSLPSLHEESAQLPVFALVFHQGRRLIPRGPLRICAPDSSITTRATALATSVMAG